MYSSKFGDIQDWAQREAMERRMDDSLLKWLGLDKPPEQRVRHKVWRRQLTESTRQLKLGADRARQRTELEMLDGTEVYRAAAGEESEGDSEWEDWSAGDWIAGTGVEVAVQVAAGARAQLEAIEGELAPSQGLLVLPAGHAEQLAGELPREAAKSGVEVEVEAVAVPILLEEAVETGIPAVQRIGGREEAGPSFVLPANHAEHLVGELAKESGKRQEAAEQEVATAEAEAALRCLLQRQRELQCDGWQQRRKWWLWMQRQQLSGG